MSDNGAAMLAAEITEGLARLGILHETTLAYSPYQNGKCECAWGNVEGRLMAMLEGVTDLTLATLNEATQAWCEFEYNRTRHSQTGQTPLERFLAGPQVLRPSLDSTTLRLAFTRTQRRTQRHSDGTLVIEAQRFEVPNCYRHLRELYVRYASWDLSQVHLLDERSGQLQCRLNPQDKQRNASGMRAPLEPLANGPTVDESQERGPMINTDTINTTAPLLQKLLAQQGATGLPPAYLPKDEEPPEEVHDP
jgi:putative transposase